MLEAADKLENSPSVTSARLHDTARFDVDVTASTVCAPAAPCCTSTQRATSNEHHYLGGTSKAQTCTTISRGTLSDSNPCKPGLQRNTYLVYEPLKTPCKDSGMQHLASVRYTSCAASIMLQDKASCALAAMTSQSELLTCLAALRCPTKGCP